MAIDKLVEFVVQRRATDTATGVVDMDLDLATLDDNRHRERMIVHIQRGETYRIEQARKAELAVYHITGVHITEFLIADGLQVEFATIER